MGTEAPKGIFGRRHEQIFLVFLGILVAYALRVNFSVGIVAMTDNSTNPDYAAINWTSAEKGTLSGAFFWGYMVTQIPAGIIASRYGPTRFLASAMIFCGVATLLIPVIALTSGYYGVYAFRIIQGLGQGFLYPCVNTHMSKWAIPLERGRLFSFAFGGSQLGSIIMLGIGGFLAAGPGGWPSIYYVSGGAAIVWGIVFLMFGADSPASHKWISEEEKIYIESNFSASSKDSNKMSPPWKSICTSVPLWALLLVHLGQNWGFWTLLTLIPSYLSGVLHFKIQENGIGSALPYFAMWILTFVFAFTADFVNKHNVLTLNVSRKMWNSIAHYGGALALLILAYSTTYAVGVITLLTIAVALNAGCYTGYLTNHLDLSPNFAGILMGITNGLANITSILGPSVAGYMVKDASSNSEWQRVFLTSATIFFIGNTIFIIFGSTDTQPWNEVSTSAKPKSVDSSTITISNGVEQNQANNLTVETQSH